MLSSLGDNADSSSSRMCTAMSEVLYVYKEPTLMLTYPLSMFCFRKMSAMLMSAINAPYDDALTPIVPVENTPFR